MGALYVFFSSTMMIFNKAALRVFPFPMQLTAFQYLKILARQRCVHSRNFFKHARSSRGQRRDCHCFQVDGSSPDQYWRLDLAGQRVTGATVMGFSAGSCCRGSWVHDIRGKWCHSRLGRMGDHLCHGARL